MAGFDPLAIIAPDLYAKQLAIQRKQALAAQLLGSGMENPTTRFSGLASAGRNILGALLAKSGDSDMAALYAPPDQGQSAPQGQPQAPMPAQSAPPVDPGQITNRPDGPSPQPAAPPQPAPQGQAPMPPTGGPSPAALGAALGGGSAQPQPPMQQPQAQPMQAPQQAQQQQPRTIPNAMSQAIPDLPGLTHTQSMLEYFQEPQAYWTALAPTPEFKNAMMATGGNPDAARQLLLGAAQKNATVIGRQGGAIMNQATGQYTGIPSANGMVSSMQPNGQIGVGLAPGAAQALAQSGYASQVPKALLTPHTGFTPGGGQPQASNDLTMSGNGPAANLIAPGLGNMQPQGLLPEIPAQQKPFLQGQGTAAEGRYSGTVNEAEGSPDRQNVLNNIVQLSQSGVRTGPGSEWLAHLNGVVGTVFPNSKFADSASQYQELTKFAYQNAIRAWQVAGGTGTDNQMAAQMQANVNSHMNPAALQGIAKWALAGEHAVMGKANAQNRWMAQSGNTPTSQTQFENAWRNAMDRRVYILQGMDPQSQAQYVKSLPPAEARSLVQKYQQIKALGGLQ